MTKTFASIFSGGGGSDLGLRAAGLEHAWGLEYDPKIADVYRANIGHCYTMDILDADPNKFDKVSWLHASPVCKSYSTANANKRERQLDLDCAKKTADFITALKPDYFSLENVEAYRKAKSFHLICDALAGADRPEKDSYWFNWQVLNAADFSVPQSRRRLILLATRVGFLPSLPAPTRHIGWYEAIKDLVPDFEEFYLADWMIKKYKDCKPTYIISATEMRCDSIRYPHEPIMTFKAQDKPHRILLDSGEVVRTNTIARARLHGFPNTYKWSGNKSLDSTIIGNSVCPPMMESLAKNILGVL